MAMETTGDVVEDILDDDDRSVVGMPVPLGSRRRMRSSGAGPSTSSSTSAPAAVDDNAAPPEGVARPSRVPPSVEEIRRRKKLNAELPGEIKRGSGGDKIVACMICSLIKSIDQFESEGCDNCEAILRQAGQRGSAMLHTSENFEGLIALMEPKESWVARWQRLQMMKRGLYAISVEGVLPSEIRHELESANVNYQIRDKSVGARIQHQREVEAERDEEMMIRKSRAVRRTHKKKQRNERKAREKKAAAATDANNEEREPDSPESPPRVPTLTIVHGDAKGYRLTGDGYISGAERPESGSGSEAAAENSDPEEPPQSQPQREWVIISKPNEESKVEVEYEEEIIDV